MTLCVHRSTLLGAISFDVPFLLCNGALLILTLHRHTTQHERLGQAQPEQAPKGATSMWDAFLDLFTDSPASNHAPPAREGPAGGLELAAIAPTVAGASLYAPVPVEEDDEVDDAKAPEVSNASPLAWYAPPGRWDRAELDPTDVLTRSLQCLRPASDTADGSPALTWLTSVLTRAPTPSPALDDLFQWAPLLDTVLVCYSHALIVVDSDEFRGQCRPLGALPAVASIATLIKVRADPECYGAGRLVEDPCVPSFVCCAQFLSFHLVWHESVVRSTMNVSTNAAASLFEACQRLLHELYRRDTQLHFLPADGWCLPAACMCNVDCDSGDRERNCWVQTSSSTDV